MIIFSTPDSIKIMNSRNLCHLFFQLKPFENFELESVLQLTSLIVVIYIGRNFLVPLSTVRIKFSDNVMFLFIMNYVQMFTGWNHYSGY